MSKIEVSFPQRPRDVESALSLDSMGPWVGITALPFHSYVNVFKFPNLDIHIY